MAALPHARELRTWNSTVYEWWVVSAAALAAELTAADLQVAEPDGHLVVGRQPRA